MLEAYRSIAEEHDHKLTKAILEALNAWDHQGAESYANFSKYVTQTVDSGIDIRTAIGSWVIWNIKAEQPTQQELTCASAIGATFQTSMSNSWGIDL